MAMLVVGAVTVQVIAEGSESEDAHADGVALDRSSNGTLRAARVHTEKRVWRFRAYIPNATAYTNLVTAANYPATVNCTGNALGGATVGCKIRVGERRYRKTSATTFTRRVALELMEV